MNRFKFRAWNKHTKQMDCPNVIDFRDDSVAGYETIDGTEVRGDLSFVLMQFTGLRDKHGQDIYEGDVYLHLTSNQKGVIKFDEGCFYCDGELIPSHKSLLTINNGKIIGNVYENPELVKR